MATVKPRPTGPEILEMERNDLQTTLGLTPHANPAGIDVYKSGKLKGVTKPFVATLAALQPLRSPSARDGASISPSMQPNMTTWFTMFKGLNPLGVVGVLESSHHKYRLRGEWVRPDWREAGVREALTKAALAAVPREATVEAISKTPNFYTAIGFIDSGRKNQFGATVLHWTKP